MAGDFVLCIDQGTTGSRAILINRDGNIKGSAYSEFRQIFPQPGWVEHDAEEIWQVTSRVIVEALKTTGVAPAASPRSASPTSARPRSSGTARPASPFTTPSSGSAGAPPEFANSLKKAGTKNIPLPDRPGGGRLFFGHQDQVDPGQCEGGAGARAKRGTGVRHHRFLADLQTLRRRGPCHGLHQREPHPHFQHRQKTMGRRPAPYPQHPG